MDVASAITSRPADEQASSAWAVFNGFVTLIRSTLATLRADPDCCTSGPHHRGPHHPSATGEGQAH
jgi:hypothetical protein